MNTVMARALSTKQLIIFVVYLAACINQGIFITASKNGGVYHYNTTIAVFLTDCFKMAAAVICLIKDNGIVGIFPELLKNYKMGVFYFIPAGLYSVYNNLSFVNLKHYDPTTYLLLLQMRVVITGVVFQVLFKKKLSQIQWISLFILTLGCILKEVGHTMTSQDGGYTGYDVDGHAMLGHILTKVLNVHVLLIVAQVFCSCFAGVYNEFLLKDTGAEVHIMVHNIFMYADSIICGLLVLVSQQPAKVFTREEFAKVLGVPTVVLIVINNAVIGIVTSLFLRSLNSILKTFASALDLMLTALLCWVIMIFGIPIDMFTSLSILVVTAATILYSQNPVVNRGKLAEHDTSSHKHTSHVNEMNKCVDMSKLNGEDET